MAFTEVKSASPCILFIDETDGIGGRRSGVYEGFVFWNNLISQLLELLDGTRTRPELIAALAARLPEAERANAGERVATYLSHFALHGLLSA